MHVVHKIRLQPNSAQETYFRQAAGVARFSYNWGLAEWQRQYTTGDKPSEGSLRKQLNAVKAVDYPWMLDVTKSAPQHALMNLGMAFQRFFRGQATYPTFKRRGVHDSFRADNGPQDRHSGAATIQGRRIKLPKLGWVRMREVLRWQGRILSVTISRTADWWFAAICVEIPDQLFLSESQAGSVIGIDLGVKALATLSTGEVIDGPKPHKVLLKRLRRLNKSLARKVKGSANWYKVKRKLARLHYRIRCVRTDALHKLTHRLATQYRTIGIETLNVRGMASNRHLARSVLDRGFYEFKRQLTYKAGWYGAKVIEADMWFPSSKLCSQCGCVKDTLTLSERVFACEDCGFVADRDVNAAINLKTLGASSALAACGETSAGQLLFSW